MPIKPGIVRKNEKTTHLEEIDLLLLLLFNCGRQSRNSTIVELP